MKRRSILLCILCLLSALNSKAGSDTLTIREAFDWKVGDSLFYGAFTIIDYPIPPAGPGPVNYHYPTKGFIVEERTDSPDTIKYRIHWTTSVDDTLTFTNLDTPVTKFSYSNLYPTFGGCENLQGSPTCDSSWVDCNINPCCPDPIHVDSLAITDIWYESFESRFIGTFIEKVGIAFMSSGALEFWGGSPNGYPGACGIELVYYKSDSITWQNQRYNSITEIKANSRFTVQPNPAQSTIVISLEVTELSDFDILLEDVTGKAVRRPQALGHLGIGEHKQSVDVSDLSAGIYFVGCRTHEGVAYKKLIVAR